MKYYNNTPLEAIQNTRAAMIDFERVCGMEYTRKQYQYGRRAIQEKAQPMTMTRRSAGEIVEADHA